MKKLTCRAAWNDRANFELVLFISGLLFFTNHGRGAPYSDFGRYFVLACVIMVSGCTLFNGFAKRMVITDEGISEYWFKKLRWGYRWTQIQSLIEIPTLRGDGIEGYKLVLSNGRGSVSTLLSVTLSSSRERFRSA